MVEAGKFYKVSGTKVVLKVVQVRQDTILVQEGRKRYAIAKTSMLEEVEAPKAKSEKAAKPKPKKKAKRSSSYEITIGDADKKCSYHCEAAGGYRLVWVYKDRNNVSRRACRDHAKRFAERNGMKLPTKADAAKAKTAKPKTTPRKKPKAVSPLRRPWPGSRRGLGTASVTPKPAPTASTGEVAKMKEAKPVEGA